MKTTYYLLTALILLASLVHAQTITSKSVGGNWEDASTWVSGSVPGALNDVVLAGPVAVTSSASTCRNLTINSGAILQNGGGLGWVTFQVQGNVSNAGTIRDNPAGNTLCLDLRGDVHNSGTWRPANTYLATKRAQHISMATGTRFERNFALRDGNGYVDTNGSLTASSDLTFTGQFDLHWRSIDLGGHVLTLLSQGNISWGTIQNASDIFSRDSAYFYNVTVAGTHTTLHGVSRIDAAVSFAADIVNADTIQHAGNLGWVTPVFYGRLTNNGLLRNNPINGYQLALDLRGDVINNGVWRPNATYFATQRLQYLSAAPNKPFENYIAVRDGSGRVDTNGTLVAASDLIFTGEFDLHWRSIDMDSNSVTLIDHGHIGWGTIQNIPTIYCRDSSYFYNTIVGSDVVLRGNAHIDGAVTFLGDVTVSDSMQQWGGLGWVTPEIHGSFTNNGVVMNNPSSGYGLVIKGFKDITNNGVWKARQAILDGTARRTVRLINAEGTAVSVWGKSVALAGDNVLPTLAMSSGALCYVASESSLIVEDGTTNYGWNGVDNLGKIVIPRKMTGTSRYDFYSGSYYFNTAQPDSVIVESHGRQAPPTFGNAVERWFRVRTVPSTEFVSQYLDLYYNHADLNGIVERDLRLYRSTDRGATWIMVDPTLLQYIDSTSNYVRFHDIPLSGDFVLGPLDATPVPARANIRVSIIGNSDVRVGAPNRMLVHLYNNADAPSGDVFVTLETNEKLRFLKFEDEMDGKRRTLELDDFATDSLDQQISLLVRSLGAREERDITLYATSTMASSIRAKRDQPQVFWFIAAAAVYVAGAYISDYVTDRMVQGCFDAWMPAGATAEEKALTAQEIKAALRDGAKQAGVATGKQLAEDATKRILAKKGLEHLVWPAKLGYSILSCVENTIKGMQCYLGQTMIRDVFTHAECSGTQKQVRAVTSRDPNHKSGPDGFGTDAMIARTQRMDYMIEFENAPDAQAPAYKIVVVDTLADVFDPSSVVFGRMSHDFTATRDGRVLRWEMTGIDLPANRIPPEGEGWLLFSVLPKPGLASGTRLENRALITFDLNAPIVTNTYVNALDYESPSTVMRSLPAHSADSVITVHWTSTDPAGGSGYASAEIYLAVDGGEYTAIAVQTGDSARIVCPPEHSYSFYALAKDNVGNLEMDRPTPVSIRVTAGIESASDKDFWLRAPYPNPTRASVRAEYSLPSTGGVTIEILDVLGNCLSRTGPIVQSEGVYCRSIDCSSLPAGSYFVRIDQAGKVVSRSFVIQR